MDYLGLKGAEWGLWRFKQGLTPRYARKLVFSDRDMW